MGFKQGLALILSTVMLISAASCGNTSETTAEVTEKVGGVIDLLEGCEDGVCTLPGLDANNEQVYSIVSPVGYHSVELIEQAPRLDTLDGKTIALVGGSFMASVTHAELKRCILESYPNAKVYSLNEIEAGGSYSVFGQSKQTVNFQKKLRELGVDAVISGNCGCGLCTTKEAGSSIAAEYVGIPTVTIGAPTFISQIHSTGVNRGVGVLRTAEYPGAFSSHSNKELIKNTREVVFPQIVEALTKQITQSEIDAYAGEGRRPYDEVVYYGNLDEIQEFCMANEWSDGLPVIPPTDRKEALPQFILLIRSIPSLRSAYRMLS